MASVAVALPASAWPQVEADLRRALIRSGREARLVERMLDAVRPAFIAIERAHGVVDDELCWALNGRRVRPRKTPRSERQIGKFLMQDCYIKTVSATYSVSEAPVDLIVAALDALGAGTVKVDDDSPAMREALRDRLDIELLIRSMAGRM